ncbi:MAG: type II secretion system protein GspJ [Candidatus Omnitrophota bacterium]|jgi:prepilin-type N-terminal cleavage/methylation domain-containing protein
MRRSRGFTLIEVLLVVSLAALIGMAVYSMFASAVNMMHRISDNALDEDADIFFEKVDREISCQVVFKGIPFEGTASSMSFAAPIALNPENPAERGVGRVRYDFGGSSQGFVRRQQNLHQVFKTIEGAPASLMTAATSLRFQYFVYREKDQLYEWTEEWNSAEQDGQLPAAVRLKLECARGEEAKKYERTIAIPIAGSTR